MSHFAPLPLVAAAFGSAAQERPAARSDLRSPSGREGLRPVRRFTALPRPGPRALRNARRDRGARPGRPALELAVPQVRLGDGAEGFIVSAAGAAEGASKLRRVGRAAEKAVLLASASSPQRGGDSM